MSSDATIIETGSGGIGTSPSDADRTLIEPGASSDRTIIENPVPKVPDTTIPENPTSGAALSALLLAPGATFLDYRLDRPLEIASGEAELWLMTRVDNGQQAVLKLYHRGLTFKEDVAEAVSKLDTSHVVRIYTRGRTDEAYPRHYEVMEYMAHGSLADMMKPGPLPPSAIRNVLRELSDALDHLHNAKIYHRDIKPANILVRTTNPLDLVLTDFGISSVSDLSRHQTSANRTAAYSAPEAITGVISRTCDWWSLGVIVLEMLTGRHPFSGLQENTINYELVTRGILVPTDLPAEWRQLSMGLLTKDDAKRWTGKEVKAWLDGQTDLPVGYAYEDEASRAAKSKQLERPSSFKPYEFQKTEYVDKESLALTMGRTECWDDAVKRLGRGFIGRWLKSFETEDVVNAVLDIEEDNALNADQKLAAMLLVMNAQVPLIWKGEVVTHDWLADNQETATVLLKSSLPVWVNRVRKDSWLLDVRVRRDRILEELKPHLAALPLNKQLARELALLPDARLVQLADARWRSLATASDAPLKAILCKTEMTEAEAIILLTCDQARFTTWQQAWAAYMDETAKRLDDLRQRARVCDRLAEMPPLSQRLTAITAEIETEYQTHSQRTEFARNDGALRQRMSQCQQEIVRIRHRAWDVAKTTANTQLEALTKRISARPTSLAAMQEQQAALGTIQGALNASYQECSKQTLLVRNDVDLNQLVARCTGELQALFELHDALTRFDELLAARQTTQAQRLLETAQGIFSPRDFDLEPAGRKLRELTYAYEEPSIRLNVLSQNWTTLLAGTTLGDRGARLMRWPSVRSQIAGIYSTVTTQRKALAPYANTELAVTAERVFVTIENTLHSLESRWHQVLRRDRVMAGCIITTGVIIVALAVGLLFHGWMLSRTTLQVTFSTDGKPLEKTEFPSIAVDGTPLTQQHNSVRYGQVTISVSDPRFEKSDCALKTHYGRENSVVIPLKYKRGTVNISSNLPNAVIFMDGREVGRTPALLSHVILGPVQYVLRLEGYPDLTVTGNLSESNVLSLEGTWSIGTVQVYSLPPGAAVMDGAKSLGVTPVVLAGVPVGKKTYILRFPGFKDETVTLDLLEKQTLIKWCVFEPPENIDIAVQAMGEAAQKDPLAAGHLAFLYWGGGDGLRVDTKAALKYARLAELHGGAKGLYVLGGFYKAGIEVPKDIDKAKACFAQARDDLAKWATLGDPEAQSSIGWMLETGEGYTQDFTAAMNWYCEAASQGKCMAAERVVYLASQRHLKVNTACMDKWAQIAAKQNNPRKWSVLGCCFASGVGMEKDDNKAFQWFMKAAGKGDILSYLLVGDSYVNGLGVKMNSEEGLKWYKKVIEQKPSLELLSKAQCSVGLVYYHGKGRNVDYAEAVKWLRASADLGNSNAQLLLGWMYQDGEGIKKDNQEAVKLYVMAAEQGDMQAQLRLGVAFRDGSIVPQNSAESLKWLLRAGKQGDLQAQLLLFAMYFRGQGVSQDLNEAITWCKRAADQGDTAALLLLGEIYFSEKHDNEEAVKYFQKAADKGSADAQYMLGGFFLQGTGVTKDIDMAKKWLSLAAEQGEVKAHVSLASIAVEGKDFETAAKWARLPAEKGNASCQNLLGQCYDNGKGLPQSDVEAVKWYYAAAKLGFADAQSNLAFCYYRGHGIGQSAETAVKWWKMAAKQGDKNAIHNLNELGIRQY